MTDEDNKTPLTDSIRKRLEEEKQFSDERIDQIFDQVAEECMEDYDGFSSRYELGQKVEEDDISIVYDAKHILIERDIKIRMLKNEFQEDEKVVVEFRRQADAMCEGKESSPYGRPCDFGKTSDNAYYVVFDGSIKSDECCGKDEQVSRLREMIREKIAQARKEKE